MPDLPPVTCPHHPRCPGCPLLALPYPEQLAQKRSEVTAALTPYGALAGAAVGEPRGAESLGGYRLRAKLAVDAGGVGLFAAGTHEVVDAPGCPVLRPAVARAVEALRALPLAAYGVSSIDVREVDRGVMVTLAVAEPAAPTLAPLLVDVQSQVPGLVTLSRSHRELDAVQVLGHAPTVIAGAAAERHTPDAQAPYHYAGPGAFTQTHPGQLLALHREIAARLGERLGGIAGRNLLELYAGTGALGLRLAREGGRVTLVESFGSAMELTARAAAEQGLSVQTEAADAMVAVTRLATAGARFDAVLVNPPRRGLPPAVRYGLRRLAPRLVAYVSCSPATLARDLDHLARLGLAPIAVTPYDMIPLSAAVEVLAILEPAPPPAPRILFADHALIAVEKSPHEPVTPQGEHAGSLLARVRRDLDVPAAVPVHRLDLGTSGVCLFARQPAAVAELARALAAGDKSYVALVRGVTHDKGKLRRPLREAGRDQAATTRYVRRRVVGGHSLVAVHPEQGRTHQIRRHLAGIGHPVIGDERYGDPRTNRHFEHRHGLDRPFLHLGVVRLARASGDLELRSELSPDLAAVLASLAGT